MTGPDLSLVVHAPSTSLSVIFRRSFVCPWTSVITKLCNIVHVVLRTSMTGINSNSPRCFNLRAKANSTMTVRRHRTQFDCILSVTIRPHMSRKLHSKVQPAPHLVIENAKSESATTGPNMHSIDATVRARPFTAPNARLLGTAELEYINTAPSIADRGVGSAVDELPGGTDKERLTVTHSKRAIRQQLHKNQRPQCHGRTPVAQHKVL